MTPRCTECGGAIRWYVRRSAWAHVTAGQGHAPHPPTLSRSDRLAFGVDRMPDDEATTAPAWPPLGYSEDDER